MTFLAIALKAIIVGGLVGFALGAGAARMFHAPTVQGMGAFRTLGEMNACEGDAVSHFSFGFGFFFNCWASIVSAGCFTQDILHRVIPNWAAALLLWKNPNVAETVHNPRKMAFASCGIGIILVTILASTALALPPALQIVGAKVLTPATSWLINPVMPIIFWMAAMDAGRYTGIWGTVLGGVSHMVMGNAVPGVVLGILIGKSIEESGWSNITRTLLAAIILLFTLSAFFRGIDAKLLNQLGTSVPQWLIDFHKIFGSVVK